ncbi:MAG: heavy metal translocating P-type ATPase [Ruminococcaceae bacterium]|nr:heavy metal translocating P-type ATPase [Oscillospiraceae bacterium]
MEKYDITGMSCAACSARVEKAVCAVDGVTSCSVNLLTNSMTVEGTASAQEIISAVEKAGYGAAQSDNKSDIKPEKKDTLEDRETPKLVKRLIASLCFLTPLMYVSMGHTMWSFPLPNALAENPIAIGLAQLLLAATVMVINQKFFINGFTSLLRGAPNMDTLVALGSGASFGYSVYALFAMTSAQLAGNAQAVMEYMHEFYFESAAMILTLITVGKMLEARAKGKTTDALKGLMNLAPKTARVIRDGKEITVSAATVKKGDIFVVRSGEAIPADGVVIEGECAVNESALTGESIPVDKGVGDAVSAATTNTTGYVKCEATRVGEDTTLSQIIKMVSDASATKAPIAKVADRVSGVFVPVVISIAVITAIVWLAVGREVGFALARAISVLVISCPCALGLATPVAIMVASGVGAKNGILFKNAVAIEETGKVKIVALDKTGTITSGEPSVTDIVALGGYTERQLLQMAAAIESRSEHPLAKAIVKKAEKEGVSCDGEGVSDFKTLVGSGVSALYNGEMLYGGKYELANEYAEIDSTTSDMCAELSQQGKTPLYFVYADKLAGVIAVADEIKQDSPEAIKQLKQMGIQVVMLTGDNEKTANAVGKAAGVDKVIAGVLPDGKEKVIRELSKNGKVAMVGDGINDAPALTRADIGIAIGAGSDIAIDAADVVLVKSRLSDVVAAIKLSRAALRNIHQNLFWAFIYNIIGIPLAAGVWFPIWGLKLNPMFGAAAMSLSSFCVVSNALRLNFFKVKNIKEKNEMEKTMKIKGMMCGHCEARVKQTLEALDCVSEAVVSHKKGTAIVKLNKEVSDDVLKKAVEDQGYQVIG